MTIYHENDEWFAKHAYNKDDSSSDIPERNIDVNSIKAFLILGSSPPGLSLSKNKIYKTASIEKYTNQGVWVKNIRDDKKCVNRLYVFEFQDDNHDITKIAFDLDDESIIFLSSSHLDQI